MSPHRLRQYRALDLVIRTGSVTRAAAILAVSQPAVTKLLKSLEDEIGIKLFDRAQRSLKPTAEALRLHSEIEQLFSSANRVERVASQIRSTGAGELKIAALPMLGTRFLPRVIARFCKMHPGSRISLTVLVSRHVRAQVLAGQADLGFAHPSAGSEHFVRIPMASLPGVAILPPGHRLASREILSPRDFEGEAFISLDRENRLRDLVDELFEHYDVTRGTAIDTNLLESACEFVAAGSGVSIVDLVNATASKEQVVIRPVEPAVAFGVEALRPTSTTPSNSIDAFMAFVNESLTELRSQHVTIV